MTLVATTTSVVLRRYGIVNHVVAGARRADRAFDHFDDVGEARAAGAARARDDLSFPPVEHVAGRVDDGERADDDLAGAEAGGPDAALHATRGVLAQHPANRGSGAGADVAFGDARGRGRLARLVGGLRIGTDRRIAEREIVDDRAGHDGHTKDPPQSKPRF